MPRNLPIGNGTVLVNFDDTYTVRDVYYPHVGEKNQTFGHASKFGIWVDGDFAWMGPEWIKDLRYLDETLVTDVRMRHERLGIELIFHDAVEFHLWVFLRHVTVRDLRGQKRDVRLFFNHDFHISENDVGDTAYYDPASQSVIHYKRDRWFLINTSNGHSGVQQWACGKKEFACLEGTWKDAEDGQLSGSPIAQGSVDSTVGINLTVEANGQAEAYEWVCFGINYEKVTKLDSIVKQHPALYIKRTRNYWRVWVNKENHEFASLPEDVVDLYKRSLLILRTNIDDGGAIVAGNDGDTITFSRDTYSYMWPRDGALCAYALGLAGFRQLPQRFFDFCLAAIDERGYLFHKYNPDGTLASSWLPWYRNDVPELPIQEDETALVVWALWKHFRRFREVEALKPLFRKLIVNAANFLIEYRDSQTHLPHPSYDLWEERYGVHLFTVASVIGGLEAASNFAYEFGEDEAGAYFKNAANEVREAMIKYMWNEKENRFARMATRSGDGYELDMTPDASMYGLFAFGALPADDPKVASTMKAIEEHLWVKTDIGGIARYRDDYYFQVSQDIDKIPGNPWFICTMWLAQYRIAIAKSEADLDKALDIIKWVKSHALPSGVLSEQVHPYTGEPLSVAPLSWSHATLVMCVHEYLDKLKALKGKESK